MKVQALLNNRPCTLELSDEALARLAPPAELDQKSAAAFCKVNVKTFRARNIPKNVNGMYSVKMLQDRADQFA